MEYRQSKFAPSFSFDIVEINPNLIPHHAKLISRYQDLINQYDSLPSGRKKIVQIEINAITRQLTELLNKSPASLSAANANKLCSSIEYLQKELA